MEADIPAASSHLIPLKTQEPHEDEQPRISTSLETGKPRYKSWRKKYRKMRLKFDERMDETNRLFIAENKAWNIAKRLQEEIDQILELLIDINDDPKTPAHLRYDLRLPDDPDYLLLSSDHSKMPSRAKSLSSLESRVPHTSVSLLTPPNGDMDGLLPSDLADLPDNNTFTTTHPPAFLTSDHESAYLTTFDAALSTNAALPAIPNLPPGIEAVAPATLPTRTKSVPTERDFALRCPVSVHNWLKKHQPQVFESSALDGKGPRRQDRAEGADSELEAPGSSHGGKARKSLGAKAAANASANVKREDMGFEDVDEEMGGDAGEGGAAAVGRRKKLAEGEEAYTMGGNKSGRSAKRKRAPGEQGEGKGQTKRPRKSGVPAEGPERAA